VDLLGSYPREQVLALAAALERGSDHPLAQAFRAHDRPAVRTGPLHETRGAGIEADIEGLRWRLGQLAFVMELARTGDAVPPETGSRASTIYLGHERGLVARLRVGMPLRPDADAAIRALRDMGLDVIIASGDGNAAVAGVAQALGIPQAHARLSPDEKIRLVQQLRASGRRVFMVGDGINDGPVLAAAEVSCAMGQGSAIAQSASDLLLAHDGLGSLPRAIAVARRALGVMRQNLTWALVYNVSAVPLAALGYVSPWLAALGMSLSSLGVVLNARRLAAKEKSS